MPEITIRLLSLADRDGWATLRHLLWPDTSADEHNAELSAVLANDSACFGAFAGDHLVGFAEVSQRPYGDGCDTAPVAWLEGIYVLPDYRRIRVAQRLVAAVEDWARTRHLTELGSDAELANLPSRVTHARWGFAETERVVRFRKLLT